MTDTPTGPPPEIAQVLDEMRAIKVTGGYHLAEVARVSDWESRLRALLAAQESGQPADQWKAALRERREKLHRVITVVATDLRCPFCNEDGFDAIGLKIHLSRAFCEAFENCDRELAARPVSEPTAPTPPAEAPVERRAEALTAGAAPSEPSDDLMREASRVSGCAWNCFRRMTTGETDHGYCSHCQMVAAMAQEQIDKALRASSSPGSRHRG